MRRGWHVYNPMARYVGVPHVPAIYLVLLRKKKAQRK